MHNPRMSWLLLVILLLAGCLNSGRPTRIPWIPTALPSAAVLPTSTIGAQVAATPTRQATARAQTPTPIQPTATPQTVASTATAPAEPEVAQAITLELPVTGQEVSNPLRVKGQAAQMPFEGTLVIRVYDDRDQLAAEVPIIAEGEYGSSATFEAEVLYGGIPGAGRVEVLEFSPRDDSIRARASVDVSLLGFRTSANGGYIEQPAPFADVTLPIKLLARVGAPDQEVNVTVAWGDAWSGEGGEAFAHVFTTLAGTDGSGLLIVPLDVVGPGFTHPPTQRGRIEIHSLEGEQLAYQPIHILHPQDPGTMGVQVFWVRNETTVPQTLRIPRTQGIARAALEALIWGPVPHNQEGYSSVLPSPAQILAYPARDASWGEHIRIRGLTIKDGVAHADFSVELGAHPGGAMATGLIRKQIEQTLTQFSTVDSVEITVNGMPGVLEP